MRIDNYRVQDSQHFLVWRGLFVESLVWIESRVFFFIFNWMRNFLWVISRLIRGLVIRNYGRICIGGVSWCIFLVGRIYRRMFLAVVVVTCMLGVWLGVMDQLLGLMCILLRYALIRSSFSLIYQICYQMFRSLFKVIL